MMSNLISAMRDAIKSETELYTMRIQQQMNRYCSVIENAVAMNGSASGGRDNYQEQIDALKNAVDSIVADLYKYKCSSVCSSDLDNELDILPEPNLVINKVKPDEIKEVHINLDEVECNKALIDSNQSSVSGSDSPREVVIVNDAIEEEHQEAPVSSTATVATNENMNEENAEEDVEDEHEERDVNADDAGYEDDVDDAEEVEEEEVEELELEEIEWKGVKYYKDSDGNVYEYLEGGEVGESIGTMSKKVAGKVLLYSTE